MKKYALLFIPVLLLSLFSGCALQQKSPQVVATTGPVYQFAQYLCQGTDITVAPLISENVSCLHDYTLQVSQMRLVEAAELVIVSGAGLEEFMEDILPHGDAVIDSSAGIAVFSCEEGHSHEHTGEHHHETDPHIWLSPANAKIMAENICAGLSARYPQYADVFADNLPSLLEKLDALQHYGEQTLSDLSTRELITFHDGFSYLAGSFHLTILEAVEEESGSEASAKTLKYLITLVREHELPAIFTERNGSVSAASVISRETGAKVFTLDMAMSGNDYFASMYGNIDTIKEALG